MSHKLIPSPGISKILGYFLNRVYPSQNAEMYFQSRVQMMRVCKAKKTAREHLESRLSFAKLTGMHSKWSSDDVSLRSCGCDATVFGIACVVRKRQSNKCSKSKIDTQNLLSF